MFRPRSTAQAEGQIKGAAAGEDDLAIPHYDGLTADEITSKLPGSHRSIWPRSIPTRVRNQNRPTVLSRVTSLRGHEPWAGYDELTVAEVQTALSEGDEELAKVRAYERSHKNRAGVMDATEREVASAS